MSVPEWGLNMETVWINEPEDRRYPFTRNIFEDRTVLYHGTWSTYGPNIEYIGFTAGSVPFDWKPFIAIAKAYRAIGGGSFFSGYYESNGPQSRIASQLFFSSSFWGARAYATNSGGEIVGATIRDAENFERLCTEPEERMRRIHHWESGLRSLPDHRPTKAAVEVLKNDSALHQLCGDVVAARERLIALSTGGHPVVYAIRIDPSWFHDDWETYLERWSIGSGSCEFKCNSCKIHPDRLVAKVSYPEGTDRTYAPTFYTKWPDVEQIDAQCKY